MSACEKQRIEKTENKLVGSWELKESTIGDKETDLTDRKIIMTFFDNDDSYKVFGGHQGEMYLTHGSYTYSTIFSYQVVSKKKDLELTVESTLGGTYGETTQFVMSTVSIAKIKNNNLTIETEDADGVLSVFKYKRVN